MDLPPQATGEIRQNAAGETSPAPLSPELQLISICESGRSSLILTKARIEGEKMEDVPSTVNNMSEAQKMLQETKSSLQKGEQLVSEITQSWMDKVKKDAQSIPDRQRGIHLHLIATSVPNPEDLNSTIQQISTRIHELETSRLAFRHQGEIQRLRAQQAKLEEYQSSYVKEVAAYASRLKDVKDGLAELDQAYSTTATRAVERAIDGIVEMKRSLAERAKASVSDLAWQRSANEDLIKRKVDPALKEMTERYTKIPVEETVKARKFIEEALIDGLEAHQAEYADLRAGPIEHSLNDLMREVDFFRQDHPPTQAYQEIAEAMTDIVIRNSLPDLRQLIAILPEGNRDLQERLAEFERNCRYVEKESSRWSTGDKVADELAKIGGLARWPAVRTKLIEDQVLTQRQLNLVEDFYFRTMMDQHGIPGGHEGAASGIAFDMVEMDSRRGFTPCVMYQMMIGGHWLNSIFSTGASGNLVDNARRKVLERMTEADIAQMDEIPEFIRTILGSFKRIEGAPRLTKEESEEMEGYEKDEIQRFNVPAPVLKLINFFNRDNVNTRLDLSLDDKVKLRMMSDSDIDGLDLPPSFQKIIRIYKHVEDTPLVASETAYEYALSGPESMSYDGNMRARLMAEMIGEEWLKMMEETEKNSLDPRWKVAAIRGLAVRPSDITHAEYGKLFEIVATDKALGAEAVRTIAKRFTEKRSVFPEKPFFQPDDELAFDSLLSYLTSSEYKPDLEEMIAVNNICHTLTPKKWDWNGKKGWLPNFTPPEEEHARRWRLRLGEVVSSWIEKGGLDEKQNLLALQSLDSLEEPQYAELIYDRATELLLTPGLTEKYKENNRGKYGDRIIFPNDANRWKVYEMLSEMMVRTEFMMGYTPQAGKPSQKDVLMNAFRRNPDARPEIADEMHFYEMNRLWFVHPKAKKTYLQTWASLLYEDLDLNLDTGATPANQENSPYGYILSSILERLTDHADKCLVTAQIVAKEIGRKTETGRILLPVAAVACEQLTRSGGDKNVPRILKLLSTACTPWLTVTAPDGQRMTEENFAALIALHSAGIDIPQMGETVEYVAGLLNSSQAKDQEAAKEAFKLLPKKDGKSISRPLPHRNGETVFREIMQKYRSEKLDLLIIKNFIATRNQAQSEQSTPIAAPAPPPPDLEEAIRRIEERDKAGSVTSAFEIFSQIVDRPEDLTGLLTGAFGSDSQTDSVMRNFLLTLYTQSIFDKLDDSEVLARLLGYGKNILMATEDHSSSREILGSVQRLLIKRVTERLFQAQGGQSISEEQAEQIIGMIQSNAELLDDYLRSV